MSIDLTKLNGHHDLLFEVPLQVRQGYRFQPTGFPDLGAAEFDSPKGRSLLVESAQSMANRLEAACWDDSANDLVDELRGLSYVKVTHNGGFLTSSVLEAHRLNSPYIEKTTEDLHKTIKDEIGVGKGGPIDRQRFLTTLLKYDVGSLVHGVFLESMDGRLRVARALSSFIEAHGVKVAASGGVKNDRVQPAKDEAGGRTAREGFGNLPFPRDEYTAEQITLYASVDLGQIRGYGLGEDTAKLLILVALFKLRAFVDGPMRLRTACTFELENGGAIESRNVKGFELPTKPDLVTRNGDGKFEGELPNLIAKLAERMRVTTVSFKA
jgi:CRISPR-associated protein Csb1